MKKSDPATIVADATSTTIVLVYTGDGRSARNAPARDLTSADLARLAYCRSLAETEADGIRPDPREPDPEVVALLVAELTEAGIFSADPSAIAAVVAETEPVAPTEAPVVPAVSPEA